MDQLSPSRHLFILGCERSGSTWMGNVIAAHPAIEFLMEPFADYANIFPGFPGRNLPIAMAEEPLVRLVRGGYSKLPGLKRRYSYRRGKSPYFKVIDRARLRALAALARASSLRLSERHEQFLLLNLNQAEIPIREHPRERADYELIATKELRLNFKIGLLRQVFSNCKFLIVIRHPGAQIRSVLRLMSKGALNELSNSLISLVEHVRTCTRFEKYRACCENWSRKSDEEKLLTWWLINYDVLIEDCNTLAVDHLVVRHEELACNPRRQYRQVFDFVGMDFPAAVEDYVTASSTAEGHQVTSAMDTSRDSATYVRETLANVDPALQRLINTTIGKNCINTHLRAYCG